MRRTVRRAAAPLRPALLPLRPALHPVGATFPPVVPGPGLDALLGALHTAFAARLGAQGRLAPGSVPSPALPADDALPPDVPTGQPDDAPPAPEGETAIGIDLVRRAQAGDVEAFGLLYDRYADQVFRYLAFRVPNRQLAEDLTSETFLRALRRIGTFTWQGRDVGAWFVTIARNLVADHYKSGRYRLELSVGDVTDVSAPAAAPVEQGPEAVVLSGITHEVLLAAVKQLNPEQQECIALRFLQGLSVSETAEIMGKNDGAIKALQHRAVKSLGRLLPPGWER
jgi:RNA polymerase sigma-70 factor (ECF subfamily)